MLLRRITEHVKAQNWTAVALDFVIVVVGVFMGIQLGNWNEARQGENTAQEYIVRIQNDLVLNLHDMKVRQEYFEVLKAHAYSAIQALEGPPDEIGKQFILDSWFATFALQRVLVRDSYDELLSVGAMDKIADISVRHRIAQHYRAMQGTEFFFNNIPAYRTQLRGALPYEVQLALREGGCTGSYDPDDSGSQAAKINNDCKPLLTDAQISAAIESLNTPEIKFALNNRLADIDTKLLLFDTAINRAKNLHDFLEETK